MNQVGIKNPKTDLTIQYGLYTLKNVYWNLPVPELVEHSILKREGVLADSGALAILTGEFTGRSPEDRFVVKDKTTENTVDWTSKDKKTFNKPIDPEKFDGLLQKMKMYFRDKSMYVKDAYVCADPEYRLNLRLIAEKPWSAMFAGNMFMRPTQEELLTHEPEWTILCAPGFHANPAVDGTRQSNFAILNFAQKMILIGGTGYTGEIKKGIFSVLNYVLPQERGVLSMHCSANVGKKGDTAVFFGLSGTGKTTLSADPNRFLIGDDEHGWSDKGVFNFEGGCYAKCIDLTKEKEPQIYDAIRHGAILENIVFNENTRTPNYSKSLITENTRVSYPLHFIDNALEPSMGGHPKNIFFLTCDASGVLPPIARLTPGQAKYHFISGYTAKVAGTEAGIKEPKLTFSACFGAPFLPLHPTKYAQMLSDKMRSHKVNIWLINTGWTGGAYGVGTRMKLAYTRATITAALEGKLDKAEFETLPIFGLSIPKSCPDVPSEVLNPRNTWSDKRDYDKKASALAIEFDYNFKKFEDQADQETRDAAPIRTMLPSS